MKTIVIFCVVLFAFACSKKVTTGHYDNGKPLISVSVTPLQNDEPVVAEFTPEDKPKFEHKEIIRAIYFDFDKAALREESIDVLDEIAQFNYDVIVIHGHCDVRGSVEYNQALGDRRANSAKDYLTGKGIPIEKIKTQSYGKSEPVALDCKYDICHQKNRRDVILVVTKANK